jgi:hypothetical protein
MTGRRPLGDTLIDVGIGALDSAAAMPGLFVREVAVTLPIDVALRRVGDEIDLLGDVPRTVTRTRFDSEPARLAVVWQCGEPI